MENKTMEDTIKKGNLLRIVYKDDKGRRCTSFHRIGDLIPTELLQVTFHEEENPNGKLMYDNPYDQTVGDDMYYDWESDFFKRRNL
jgi:hypothetical protein